jgi:membrane associated rhomboid family serine protease
VFSCIVSSANGVGASVAIYGLLGAYITFFLMNWNALDRIYGHVNKYTNLLFMLFMILLNLSYGFSNPIIDNWGHLGGLIFGFFLMWIMEKPQDERDTMCCKYSIWYYISAITLTFLYIGGFLILFLVRQY